MARVCEFHGIVIQMYNREHDPPYFHAIYGEHKARIGIDPIGVLNGRLPARAQRLFLEWAELHQIELVHNWQRVRRREPVVRTAPLD